MSSGYVLKTWAISSTAPYGKYNEARNWKVKIVHVVCGAEVVVAEFSLQKEEPSD